MVCIVQVVLIFVIIIIGISKHLCLVSLNEGKREEHNVYVSNTNRPKSSKWLV